ncbi:hypothetical protein RRF57_002906 [Xylaria bambusicola]|uniref:Uncharacterized protein n=1 Tax=Xylaria bambusicola TaxID=326684 RepID=A0AAN7UKY4_9PEZI
MKRRNHDRKPKSTSDPAHLVIGGKHNFCAANAPRAAGGYQHPRTLRQSQERRRACHALGLDKLCVHHRCMK